MTFVQLAKSRPVILGSLLIASGAVLFVGGVILSWPDGRQYVLIAPGGHQGMTTKIGDYILAYALPRSGA